MLRRVFFITLFLCSTSFASGNTHHEKSSKIFSGTSNKELAKTVADLLGLSLGKANIGRFNDGEIRIEIEENVRNCDVFILQSVCISPGSTVNDNLMELFLMVRAAKRASAKKVTAIIPYYGYARQDRKTSTRAPISASDIAMILELAGADHVIAMDLHCGQIQGFFHDIPVDDLHASPIFIPHLSRNQLQNPVIVSPDAGGVTRAKILIEHLHKAGINAHLAIIVKQRAEAGVIESMNLIGNVSDSDVIIVDDICDTAGTLVEAAKELKNQGAKRVFACITHPLFSEPAIDRISRSCIDKLFVTNTIPLRKEIPSNIEQLSIASLLADAITHASLSDSQRKP